MIDVCVPVELLESGAGGMMRWFEARRWYLAGHFV